MWHGAKQDMEAQTRADKQRCYQAGATDVDTNASSCPRCPLPSPNTRESISNQFALCRWAPGNKRSHMASIEMSVQANVKSRMDALWMPSFGETTKCRASIDAPRRTLTRPPAC